MITLPLINIFVCLNIKFNLNKSSKEMANSLQYSYLNVLIPSYSNECLISFIGDITSSTDE